LGYGLGWYLKFEVTIIISFFLAFIGFSAFLAARAFNPYQYIPEFNLKSKIIDQLKDEYTRGRVLIFLRDICKKARLISP